jgi:hypothetical protein
MVNKWIEHVKKYSKDNNIAYTAALKDSTCKSSYKSDNNESTTKKKPCGKDSKSLCRVFDSSN